MDLGYLPQALHNVLGGGAGLDKSIFESDNQEVGK